MSTAQLLRDLREDVATLLEYSQKLKAENDILRSVLRGSIVFLANDNKEKVYGAVTGSGIVPPALKTVRNIPNGQVSSESDTPGDKQRKGVNSPVLGGSHVHPPVSSQASSVFTDGGFTEVNSRISTRSRVSPVWGVGRKEGESAKFTDECFDDSKTPAVLLHTASDLAEVLVEHNKLQGRLLQFTSNQAPLSSTTIPNIRDHNLKDVSVVGCQLDHQKIQKFVIHTTWTNGQRFKVHRKYQDFFTFQATLSGLTAWNQSTTQARTIPELPLSDHLLTVLGRLNTQAALRQRRKLIDNFCKAVVGEVANRTGGDICRMSVLIFFACRPGDVEMQTHTNTHGVSTTQSDAECDFEFLSEDEKEDDSEECLGFISSVALANEAKWWHTHRDLADDPKPKAKRDDVSNFRFANRSSAPPVVTHTPPAKAEIADITRPGTTPTQVIANLSNLKRCFPSQPALQEENSDLSIVPNCDNGVCVLPLRKNVNGDTMDAASAAAALCHNVAGDLEFRRRNTNQHYSSKDISLARMKAASIKSGNMDWNCFHVRGSSPKSD